MEDDDDDDSILTPAGPVRVVVGLIMMVSGVVLAALTDNWIELVGLFLFLLSPFVMVVTRPADKNS